MIIDEDNKTYFKRTGLFQKVLNDCLYNLEEADNNDTWEELREWLNSDSNSIVYRADAMEILSSGKDSNGYDIDAFDWIGLDWFKIMSKIILGRFIPIFQNLN